MVCGEFWLKRVRMSCGYFMGKTDIFASFAPEVLDLAYLSGSVRVMLDKPETDSGADEYLTPTEASKILYLSTKQLTRYADDGKLRYIRPGSHRRYLAADVHALATRPEAVAR